MKNEDVTKAGLQLDADDPPILDDRFFANAGVRIGGKRILEPKDTQARRGRPPNGAAAKVQQSLRLSPEVLDWFRATGEGWQARMDAVLLAHVRGEQDRRAA